MWARSAAVWKCQRPPALDQVARRARHNAPASSPQRRRARRRPRRHGRAISAARHRLVGGEQRRLDRAHEVVHRPLMPPSPPDAAARSVLLPQLGLAEPRQLERGDEARGERRTAKARVLRSPGRKPRARVQSSVTPIIARAGGAPRPASSPAGRATMWTTGSVRARDAAIGGDQVVRSALPGATADHLQPLGRAAAGTRRGRRRSRAISRAPPRASPAAAAGAAAAASPAPRGSDRPARVLGQEQAGFEVGEPGRHHQIIGGDLEPAASSRRR